MKEFVIYYITNGSKHFYCYTSIVGIIVTSFDVNEAKVYPDGNDMRKAKNHLKKNSKNDWKSCLKNEANIV